MPAHRQIVQRETELIGNGASVMSQEIDTAEKISVTMFQLGHCLM